MANHARIGTALTAMRAWFGKSPERRSLSRVFGYLVSTRLTLWFVAYVAVRMNHPRLHPRARHDFRHAAAIVAWLRWDAWWYVSVVEDGYSFDPHGESNVAFLPGFPVLIALLTRVCGSAAVAGLVVANVSFVLAIIVFWGWVRERAGVAAAERAAVWLLLYPLSFFFNTVYSEGPFFLVSTLALRDADRGRWLTAGVFASLATLTRPMGLFLVPAFAWALARDWRAGRLERHTTFAVLAPVAALGLYSVYLRARVGHALAIWTAQRVGWGVGGYWNLFQLPERADVYRNILDVFHLIVPFVLVVLTVKAWRRLGVASGVFATLAVATGIAFGWDSLGREALSVIPAFAAAGLTICRPVTTTALRLAAFALLVVFTYAFAMGHFMG